MDPVLEKTFVLAGIALVGVIGTLSILSRHFCREWAFKGFLQAIRWTGAGVMVGAVLSASDNLEFFWVVLTAIGALLALTVLDTLVRKQLHLIDQESPS